MSVYQRYFRVTQGALIDRLLELKAQKEAGTAAYLALRDEVGAENVHVYSGGNFAGFSFKEPDRNLYREQGGAWLPRKNSKRGKELWAKINQLPKVPGAQRALDACGLGGGHPVLFCDGYAWSATVSGYYDRNIWFVKVPWKDIDPQELEQYKADKASKTRLCADLDHLLWEPPAEWEEIKEWQFLKEWEELQAKEAA